MAFKKRTPFNQPILKLIQGIGRNDRTPETSGLGPPSTHAGRNKRTVWTVNPQPYKDAHFATFPSNLILPCILAGTSERGACADCGAPWVRVVERESKQEYRPDSTGKAMRESQPAAYCSQPVGRKCGVVEVETKGWRPTCACQADPVPCTVIDPFAGAGTTGLVADRRGRDAILLELNPEYCELARRRILDDAPLFAEVS